MKNENEEQADDEDPELAKMIQEHAREFLTSRKHVNLNFSKI